MSVVLRVAQLGAFQEDEGRVLATSASATSHTANLTVRHVFASRECPPRDAAVRENDRDTSGVVDRGEEREDVSEPIDHIALVVHPLEALLAPPLFEEREVDSGGEEAPKLIETDPRVARQGPPLFESVVSDFLEGRH